MLGIENPYVAKVLIRKQKSVIVTKNRIYAGDGFMKDLDDFSLDVSELSGDGVVFVNIFLKLQSPRGVYFRRQQLCCIEYGDIKVVSFSVPVTLNGKKTLKVRWTAQPNTIFTANPTTLSLPAQSSMILFTSS